MKFGAIMDETRMNFSHVVVGNWLLNFIIYFLMVKEQNVQILRIFIIEVQIYIWFILHGWLQRETQKFR